MSIITTLKNLFISQEEPTNEQRSINIIESDIHVRTLAETLFSKCYDLNRYSSNPPYTNLYEEPPGEYNYGYVVKYLVYKDAILKIIVTNHSYIYIVTSDTNEDLLYFDDYIYDFKELSHCKQQIITLVENIIKTNCVKTAALIRKESQDKIDAANKICKHLHEALQ